MTVRPVYYILRVWLPTERRYYWRELFNKRDWNSIIPGTRWQIWACDDDAGTLVWPSPPGAEAIALEMIRDAARLHRPPSRSERAKCRRRLRRFIREQVGGQRETDDWAQIVGEAAAYLLQYTKDGVLHTTDAEPTPLERRHTRKIEKQSRAKHRVRLKC